MKVLISTSSFAVYDSSLLDQLKKNGFEIVLNTYKRTLNQEELIELAQGCGAIIAGTEKYSKQVFDKLPSLEMIIRVGTGVDGIDTEEAKKRKILVKNTKPPTDAVAELTICLMLDLLRHVSLMSSGLKQGKWEKTMGHLLKDKTVGIVGLGNIGKRVAELLSSFNVMLIACEPYPDKKWLSSYNVKLVSLDELLSKSDLVSLHVPHSKENHHLIDSRKIALLKKGAYILNTSRGGLLDEQALFSALTEGKLAGAALDVMEEEPYKGNLCSLPNVILTPHIGSYAAESRIQMEREAVENLLKAFRVKK